MPIVVSKTNTKIYQSGGGWVKLVYDTGQKDANGKAITVTATFTQASIEESVGKLLPKSQVKSIVEAALNQMMVAQEQELSAL